MAGCGYDEEAFSAWTCDCYVAAAGGTKAASKLKLITGSEDTWNDMFLRLVNLASVTEDVERTGFTWRFGIGKAQGLSLFSFLVIGLSWF